MAKRAVCGRKCEIFSRVCGYYRPVVVPTEEGKEQKSSWNKGKLSEWKERKEFVVDALPELVENKQMTA